MTFKFGPLPLDPAEIFSTGNAVLGIKDSGKSYTATELAEHSHDAGIPFIAFDPTGIWKYLRVPGKGKGRPVVVVGGKDGDLPLNPATVPKIVEAAMASGLSLVIDLSGDLSKADWRRIVRDCVRILMQKNYEHGLRHVFIEEAAEFIPQRVTDGLVYAEVEKLARVGGNMRLGYTIINQRAEEVNKAVLELCDNLFLHRQKGKNSLLSLGKWLDVADVGTSREIIKSLPTLPNGECWAWLREASVPVLVKVPEKDSFHPDRRVLRGTVAIKRKKVDAAKFVDKLKATLPEIEAEAAANDVPALRKRIADLTKQIEGKETGVSRQALKAGLDDAKRQGYAEGHHAAMTLMLKRQEKMMKILARVQHETAELGRILQEDIIVQPAEFPMEAVKISVGTKIVDHTKGRKLARIVAISSDLSKPRQTIINTLCALGAIGINAPDKAQLALWCEVSPTSGGYGQNLAALNEAGLITYPQPGAVAITDAGVEKVTVDLAINGSNMREKLCEKVGGPRAKIMRALFETQHANISKNDLAERIGVSPTSGGYGQNLASLKTLGVIEYPSPGLVRAAPICFME